MVPPSIMYCLGNETLLHEDFTTKQFALKAEYDAAGVIVQLHFHGTTNQLFDHLEALGLDTKKVVIHEFTPTDEIIDLLEREDIDPRYKQVEMPDYFVVVNRRGVRHFFDYTVAEQRGRSLEDFLDELGYSSGHPDVAVTNLSLVDWEDREDWKEVEDMEEDVD